LTLGIVDCANCKAAQKAFEEQLAAAQQREAQRQAALELLTSDLGPHNVGDESSYVKVRPDAEEIEIDIGRWEEDGNLTACRGVLTPEEIGEAVMDFAWRKMNSISSEHHMLTPESKQKVRNDVITLINYLNSGDDKLPYKHYVTIPVTYTKY